MAKYCVIVYWDFFNSISNLYQPVSTMSFVVTANNKEHAMNQVSFNLKLQDLPPPMYCRIEAGLIN